jgi:hypothetical protein
MNAADLITGHLDTWIAVRIPMVNGGRGRSNHSNGQSSYGIKNSGS